MSKKKGGAPEPKAVTTPATTTPKVPPVLTDRRGMGGVNAQDGFDYQICDGLLRVPAWLLRQSFEGIIFEGLEDLEARFFPAHAPKGHFVDRFQAKLSELSKAELSAVFESFMAFDEHHPQIARIHTLVTPSLPAKFRWLSRDFKRVRDARPFYDPFPQVLASTADATRANLGAEFGQTLGDFIARSVEFSTRSIAADRTTAESWFASEMTRAFPHLDVSAKRLHGSFAHLLDLVTATRGQMVTRAQIITSIEDGLATSLALPGDLQLHVRSDRTSPETEALEIDASPFCGGGRGVPHADDWQRHLVAPLTNAARWAYRSGYRRVRISGQFRLSPAFVVGWAFRSSTGFELDVPTKTGDWNTDAHPPAATTTNPWQVTQPTAHSDDRLIVAICVVRDGTPAVRAFYNVSDDSSLLVLRAADGVPNAVEAQRLVQSAKTTVLDAVTRFNAKRMDMFFLGPAALAIALGHRWNAMPPTRMHEYDPATHQYRVAALLTA